MKRVVLYILCLFCLSNYASARSAIKCFKKVGKATPWELIQAIDSLFEQNSDLRTPCEIIALHSRSCNQLNTCEEQQHCYYQLQRKNSAIPEDMWKQVSRIPPIVTYHSFRLSNNSDTVIYFGVANSILYDNKYADICLISCYFLKENTAYTSKDLSRKQRQYIAQRFEEEVVQKVEKILNDIAARQYVRK